MDHIPRLSDAVYVGLCHEIGSPTEVRIRREVMDTEEVLEKPLFMKSCDKMLSGSRRDGFRLSTSDTDWMLWGPDHKVICDLSQIGLYCIPQHTVILMECDDLPPGFTRLNLMSPPYTCTRLLRSACVFMNRKVYISSALYRDTCLRELNSKYGVSFFHHGPCSTIISGHDDESDYAFCFKSHHWPSLARPWVQRCRQQGWPFELVLSKIISTGFHVVPIGTTPENGEEWRISFSQAENQIVYSMNHCQFLCYGLVKLFLKEVINILNNTNILCSYFMKTLVFWVIQNVHSLIWTPDNLLFCFWKCFKLLLHWVHIGECPNFFIPQNNMFRVKVTGSVQTALFSQLYGLYCKGIPCLLLSTTLRPYLSNAILYRTLRVCTDESRIISSTDLDISFFKELQIHMIIHTIEEFQVYLKNILNIIIGNLTTHQIATLQYLTSGVLRSVAFLIPLNKTCNKLYYKTNKISTLLKVSCTFGCVSDILYLAMYFYRARRYEHSLSILQRAQERMSPQYIPHYFMNVNAYIQCIGWMPLDKKIRTALVQPMILHNSYTYIDELLVEQKISKKHGLPYLFISHLVMLHMLFILNHHRLGDTVRAKQSLQDLQTLLLNDDLINVPTDVHVRDISWQILGICQHICGDYLGSLESYKSSLKQIQYHKIQEATMFRINSLTHEEM